MPSGREVSDVLQTSMAEAVKRPLGFYADTRAQLLFQHQGLRALLGDLRAVAAGVLAGNHAAIPVLRMRLNTVCSVLHCHLIFEDTMLGPVLERLGAWGPLRLERMRAEHARQSELLASLAPDRARALSGEGLARQVCVFADRVAVDMADEERDLLDPAVLRDEAVDIAPNAIRP